MFFHTYNKLCTGVHGNSAIGYRLRGKNFSNTYFIEEGDQLKVIMFDL